VAIDLLHCYVNYRRDVDWNTCGQAAIATIADYWDKNPYDLPRTTQWPVDRRCYWNDGAAIDAITAGGFGPDVIFGWGTTPSRIGDALRHYGLPTEVDYSSPFGSSDDHWKKLQDHLARNRPVPVLLDLGVLGSDPFLHHWPIAYKVDGGRVHLGNYFTTFEPPTVEEFLKAWHCQALPWGFNYAGVYA
jgi:hypothetical protein